MRKIFLTLAVASCVLLPLTSASGGDSIDCQCRSHYHEPDWGYPAFWDHRFEPGGDRAYTCDVPGCHSSWRNFTCSSEHAGCGPGFAGDLESILSDAAAALAVALEPGVVYNAPRNAIQSLDCNGAVVQSVVVPAEFAPMVAAAYAIRWIYA